VVASVNGKIVEASGDGGAKDGGENEKNEQREEPALTYARNILSIEGCVGGRKSCHSL
jgi:hypothetical protein